MSSFSDDFNRADGAIGANYDTSLSRSALAVFSNQVRGSAVGINISAVKTSVATFAADQYAELTISNAANFDYVGPAVRVDAAAGTGYASRHDPQTNATCRLVRFTSTTVTTIGTINTPAATNDVIRVVAEGSNISLYKNGVLIETVVDATYATGQPGVFYDWGNNRSTRGDNFVASNLVVGPTVDTQPVADVGLINGDPARRSTVYTAVASGTNVQAPTWYEGASPVAHGGIYGIVTTGAGTSECTSTLTITRAAKAGTPFNIKANFADANGNTDTNTVTDTWYTGPVLSKSNGTTNASGVDTLTITSDYPNADGEFTVIEATAGGVTKTVSLHYDPA